MTFLAKQLRSTKKKSEAAQQRLLRLSTKKTGLTEAEKGELVILRRHAHKMIQGTKRFQRRLNKRLGVPPPALSRGSFKKMHAFNLIKTTQGEAAAVSFWLSLTAEK